MYQLFLGLMGTVASFERGDYLSGAISTVSGLHGFGKLTGLDGKALKLGKELISKLLESKGIFSKLGKVFSKYLKIRCLVYFPK